MAYLYLPEKRRRAASQIAGGSLGATDPASSHRVLIFYGFSGAKSAGLTLSDERDQSFRMVALTLSRHVKLRFPKDEIEVVCAWHKNSFVKALMTPSPSLPDGKIRQIHYIGHGNPGGLWFSYKNPKAVAERNALANALYASSEAQTVKRIKALLSDAGLMTGYFTDALGADGLAKIKQQLLAQASMQIWGCFAGIAQHTFDWEPYWELFNAAGVPTDGIARHVAKALGINVTAVYDPNGVQGTNFWYRTPAGKVQSSPRPALLPQWLWPLSSSEHWVTYDATGKADETNILFLGQIKNASNLKPGQPPSWLTKEIPLTVKASTPRESCSPAAVGF